MDTCLSTKVYLFEIIRFIYLFDSQQYDQDSSSQIIDEVEWHNETSPGTVHYFRDENGWLKFFEFNLEKSLFRKIIFVCFW